jgi:RNA polymerase sigma factor (sigma-70 family)
MGAIAAVVLAGPPGLPSWIHLPSTNGAHLLPLDGISRLAEPQSEIGGAQSKIRRFRDLRRANDYSLRGISPRRCGRTGRSIANVSSHRLGGGDVVFAPGEAEEMVRELRGHLRTEQELRQQGRIEAAARARTRAASIIGDLARRLERRFERYARAYFDDAPQMVDDAVAEMFTELCRRLQDVSATNDLMERRFNYVVKLLIVDAIRKVRAHNGLTKDGEPDTKGFQIVSLEAANDRADAAADGERLARPCDTADPQGMDEFERVVERMLGKTALEWLQDLPPRQRRVVQARLFDGCGWADVASQIGVSSKTAQTDFDQALAELRRTYAKTLEGGER